MTDMEIKALKNLHTSKITLNLHTIVPGDPAFRWVEVQIDSIPLATLVNTYEKKLLAGSADERLAGNYWYLHPLNLLESLEKPEALVGGQITVLEYSWMPVDYRPIVAQMRQEEDYILWYNFRQLREPGWDYSSFRSFIFKKDQLFEQVAKIKARAKEYTSTL
ncbi:MAG TPA: hypothetical protein PLD45_04610 [Spirochaetales bacterium]|jgi:hypothetical protein|nr:hypothetical protein [Spirochaetales bacterium]